MDTAVVIGILCGALLGASWAYVYVALSMRGAKVPRAADSDIWQHADEWKCKL